MKKIVVFSGFIFVLFFLYAPLCSRSLVSMEEIKTYYCYRCGDPIAPAQVFAQLLGKKTSRLLCQACRDKQGKGKGNGRDKDSKIAVLEATGGSGPASYAYPDPAREVTFRKSHADMSRYLQQKYINAVTRGYRVRMLRKGTVIQLFDPYGAEPESFLSPVEHVIPAKTDPLAALLSEKDRAALPDKRQERRYKIEDVVPINDGTFLLFPQQDVTKSHTIFLLNPHTRTLTMCREGELLERVSGKVGSAKKSDDRETRV